MPSCRLHWCGCSTNMGILPQFFFPEGTGAAYQASPYLERLAGHRQNLTVFFEPPDMTLQHRPRIDRVFQHIPINQTINRSLANFCGYFWVFYTSHEYTI